jgi:hypothetical protein
MVRAARDCKLTVLLTVAAKLVTVTECVPPG